MDQKKNVRVSGARWFQRISFPKKLGLCELFFGKRLERRGIVTVMTGAGLNWRLDLRNPAHRWMLYGDYDPAFLPWAKRFLRPDGVVVDSGANIGQMTAYLGRSVPNGRCFSFEPGTAQAAWLEASVEANRRDLPTVEVHRLALGAEPAGLFLEDTWRSEKFHGGSSEISTERGEPVRVVRLADFLNERGVGHVDLWKLDVEGYELPALKGAEPFLKEQRVKALYVELFRQEGERYMENGVRIREYLKKMGYDCYVFRKLTGRLVRETRVTRAADGLFLPGEGLKRK